MKLQRMRKEEPPKRDGFRFAWTYGPVPEHVLDAVRGRSFDVLLWRAPRQFRFVASDETVPHWFACTTYAIVERDGVGYVQAPSNAYYVIALVSRLLFGLWGASFAYSISRSFGFFGSGQPTPATWVTCFAAFAVLVSAHVGLNRRNWRRSVEKVLQHAVEDGDF